MSSPFAGGFNFQFGDGSGNGGPGDSRQAPSGRKEKSYDGPQPGEAMSDDQLRAIVKAEERNALGYLGGILSEDRKKALDYYFGDPFGNEIADRSQVVSTDVADTIEWIMPSLMRVFAAGDNIVGCEPNHEEDEAIAKQASEYLNWIFLRDNPGFLVLHDAIKDALLLKSGVFKVWWDATPKYREQSYFGLTPDTIALLQIDEQLGKIEIVAVEPSSDGVEPTFDVKIRKTVYNGKCNVAAVPPDEFLIARDARDIETSRYIGHRRQRTISSLIEEGYDQDVVETLIESTVDLTGESTRRIQDIDEQRFGAPSSNADPSTREAWITESYILADRNGDGIAERLKIVTGNEAAILLTKDGVPDIEEWEGPVPFGCISPILMPHRIIGRSVADLVMDLQLIKSVVLRQILDNMYLVNNARSVISDQVEIDDMLNSRPGGVVRLKEGALPSQGHVMPLEVPAMAQSAYPLMDYLDSVKENRTGVTKYNQGLDADTLNKTKGGMAMIMSAAQQRLELIARVFAETGVKQIFKLLLWNVCRYQDKPRVIRLRNQWVPMDPTGWDAEMDITIDVGIGTGSRDQIVGHLQLIASIQEKIVEAQGGPSGPIVNFENIYNTAKKIGENAGFKNPDLFFTDPSNAPPMPPRPDPEMAKAQAEQQMQQAKLQSDQQAAAAKLQADQQNAQAKLAQDAQLKQMEMEMDAQLRQADAQNDQNLEMARQQNELAKIRASLAMEQAKMEQEGLFRMEEMKQEAALRNQEMLNKMQLERENMSAEFQLKREMALRDAELQARVARVKNPQLDEDGNVIKEPPDEVTRAVSALPDLLGQHLKEQSAHLANHLQQHGTMIIGALKAPRKARVVRDHNNKIVGAESVAE